MVSDDPRRPRGTMYCFDSEHGAAWRSMPRFGGSGAVSGFSGQKLYNDILYQFYNAAWADLQRKTSLLRGSPGDAQGVSRNLAIGAKPDTPSNSIPAPSNRCFLVTSPVSRNHLLGSPNSLARRVLVGVSRLCCLMSFRGA